jgi:uncharacterized protein YhfF
MSKSASDLWTQFRASEPGVDPATTYQVWYFGNTREMAGDLAGLVLSGAKTATASAVEMNRIQPENAPQHDGYSVVTDFDGHPLCVIRTTEIRHIPFVDVDADFAAAEGEGDLSLEYWRRVHWDYFTREAEQFGFEFNERSLVCCERFKLLFPR